jgi:hypothetical protein
MVHYTLERVVKAKPDELYDWFTTYTDQDHSGPNWPSDGSLQRTVLEQDNDHAVYRDRYGRMELEFHVKKNPPRGIESEGVGRGITTHGRSNLSAVPEGTKVQLDLDFTPRGVGKLFFPMMRGRLEKTINEDLDNHIKDFYLEKGINP